MIGLDTNVLVRFLVQDDPVQGPAASRYIHRHCSAETPGYINRIVLCELVWVLERAYGSARSEVARALDGMLRAPAFTVEESDAARHALHVYKNGTADFADAMIAATNQTAGCTRTATFDRKAARMETVELVAES